MVGCWHGLSICAGMSLRNLPMCPHTVPHMEQCATSVRTSCCFVASSATARLHSCTLSASICMVSFGCLLSSAGCTCCCSTASLKFRLCHETLHGPCLPIPPASLALLFLSSSSLWPAVVVSLSYQKALARYACFVFSLGRLFHTPCPALSTTTVSSTVTADARTCR